MCSEGERYDNVEQVDTRCIGRPRGGKKGLAGARGRGGGGRGLKVARERIENPESGRGESAIEGTRKTTEMAKARG